MSQGYVCLKCGVERRDIHPLVDYAECSHCVGGVLTRTLLDDLLPHEIVAAPITAWRVWQVAHTGRLRSLYVGYEWEPGVATAACQRTMVRGLEVYREVPLHSPAAAGCGCGLWAFKTPEAAAYKARHHPPALPVAWGQVELWGRVVETEFGYRAQYARPVQVHVLDRGECDPGLADVAALVADTYGCVVTHGWGSPGPPEFTSVGSLIVAPRLGVRVRRGRDTRRRRLLAFAWLMAAAALVGAAPAITRGWSLQTSVPFYVAAAAWWIGAWMAWMAATKR